MSQDQLNSFPKTPSPDDDKFVDINVNEYILDYVQNARNSELEVDDTKPISNNGLKFILLYVGLLGVMHFWSKNLMQFSTINPYEILCARGVISSIIGFVYLKQHNLSISDIDPTRTRITIIGALIGFLSLCGLYISLFTLSITDAFALDSLSVLVATFIDFVVFKGSLRFSNFVGYGCAFAGIMFLVRPSYLFEENANMEEKGNFVYGFIAGLFSAFLSGVYSGILRRTFVKVNPLISITVRQIATAILSPFAIIAFKGYGVNTFNHSIGIWFSLICIGILGWASSYTLYLALQEEKLVSRVYPFKYLLVIFGIFADLLYFKLGLIASTYIGFFYICNFILN